MNWLCILLVCVLLLLQALISASYGAEGHITLETSVSEDTTVLFLELLLKVSASPQSAYYSLSHIYYYYFTFIILHSTNFSDIMMVMKMMIGIKLSPKEIITEKKAKFRRSSWKIPPMKVLIFICGQVIGHMKVITFSHLYIFSNT